MNDKGYLEQMNKAIKEALELYLADNKKLEDGASFVTELNNCMLTISLKDESLVMEFNPDKEDFGDAQYKLDATIGLYCDMDGNDEKGKETDAPQFYRTESGVGYIKMTWLDLARYSGMMSPICDFCATKLTGERNVTLIPALNEALCPKCAEKYLKTARLIPEDAPIVRRREEFYMNFYGLDHVREAPKMGGNGGRENG